MSRAAMIFRARRGRGCCGAICSSSTRSIWLPMSGSSLQRCWRRRGACATAGQGSPPTRDPAAESRRLPMQFSPLSCSGLDAGREAKALLVAELAGGRTVLRRQHVGYPFHVTRAFQLDRMRPDLATLYLQSASGGLYAAGRLALDLVVGPDAALNLTTQASTVVHDARGQGSAMCQSVTVKDNAFCAIISDPYVLFPGADLYIETTATVATGATLIMAEGFAAHDPHGRGGTFTRLSTHTRIMAPE